MGYKNLEEALRAGNTVDMLRNSQTAPYIYPVIPPEYTNWRDEQRAWQHTCVFFNQCYHMMESYIEGPDALKLFSDLGVNSFNSFTPNKAKQFVACNYDGYEKYQTVIGEGAFIGSDTMMVAPLTIGDNAVTGAGSVITEDVEAGALAIERSEQRDFPGYSQRRAERQSAKKTED